MCLHNYDAVGGHRSMVSQLSTQLVDASSAPATVVPLLPSHQLSEHSIIPTVEMTVFVRVFDEGVRSVRVFEQSSVYK